MACAVTREVLSETQAVGPSAVLCTYLFCNYHSCVGGPPQRSVAGGADDDDVRATMWRGDEMCWAMLQDMYALLPTGLCVVSW